MAAVLLALLGPAVPVDAADDPVSVAEANHRRRQAALHRSWPDDAAPGSLLVTTADAAEAASVVADEHGERLADRVVLVRVEPGTEAHHAGRIAARLGVLAVEPDRARAIAAEPNDAAYDDQWSHRLVDAEQAWDRTTGSSTVKVAVLDSGIDGDHPDLSSNIVEQVDVSTGSVIPRSLRSDNDSCDYGHGTFVAGVLGAAGNNGRGIAGVAWEVGIVDVALSSPASRCALLDSAIVAGLHHVSQGDDPVDVANLSLGSVAESCPTAVQDAIDGARDAGVVVVAASGNEELRLPGAAAVPASCRGVISVGAVGDDGTAAVYSSANRWVDLVAPGGDSGTGRGILSTSISGGYEEVEGTSFAAPYVSGAAALLRSLDASLTPDEIEALLEENAAPKGPSGRDDTYGWGLLDLDATLDAAASGTSPDAPVADPTFPIADPPDEVERISSGAATEAIRQAAAMSAATFEPTLAVHAVVARADDYADALAGSSLSFGIGPVLFSSSTGPLASATANELRRALEPGATVYVLGGTAALPPTIEAEIAALGFEPERIAGPTREETAVAVAQRLERFLVESEYGEVPMAIVATRSNWPDAVTAGSLGAWFGMPILLTERDSLHPAVSAFLSARSWERVYVVGGTAAVSEEVRSSIRGAARLTTATVERLAGETRSDTAIAVASEMEDLFAESFGELPQQVVAVNLRRADGFAHVLSASARVGQRSGVFLPVEGAGGTEIDEDAQRYLCRFPAFAVIAGGTDLISPATATTMLDLMAGDAPICST